LAEATAESLYQEAVTLAATIFERAHGGQSIDDLPLHQLVERLNAHLKERQELLAYVGHAVSPLGENHYLATHIVNTCLLTLTLGQGLRLPDGELAQLGVCALLYDVGMARILQQATASSGSGGQSPLFEDIKRHPTVGAESLQKMRVQVERAIRVTAEHHERLDGSGYPQGLKGEAVDSWAQIVGLADLYESFTRPRSKRQHQPQAHDLLRELVTQQGLFDSQLVKVLLNQISLYPIGTWVKLNTGAVGRVCGIHQGLPLRPIVELYLESGQMVRPPRKLDLKEIAAVSVKRVVNPADEGVPAAT